MRTDYLVFVRRIGIFLAVVAVFLSAALGYAAGAPAPVPKTGQTTSLATGDDGATQKGLALPSVRFTDMGNGTVFDALTGLVWMKNANCWGSAIVWTSALAKVADLNSGAATCSGYTGGQNDWRLPSVNELSSLIDLGRRSPALPTGHPFSGVQSNDYWSGSTYASATSVAWIVYLGYGYVYSNFKAYSSYVWPVRGGQ